HRFDPLGERPAMRRRPAARECAARPGAAQPPSRIRHHARCGHRQEPSMNRIHHIRQLGLVLSPVLLLAAGAASAQDSFGQSGQAQPYPQQQQPYPQQPQQYPQPPRHQPPPQQQAPYSNQSAMPAQMPDASSEGQDFGVAPTSQLRPTQQLHGPTPTSIPGGRVIATQQLAQLLQGGQPVVLLDVLGGPQHIPGAVPVVPAAQGGGFSDEVQQGYGQYLAQVTGG